MFSTTKMIYVKHTKCRRLGACYVKGWRQGVGALVRRPISEHRLLFGAGTGPRWCENNDAVVKYPKQAIAQLVIHLCTSYCESLGSCAVNFRWMPPFAWVTMDVDWNSTFLGMFSASSNLYFLKTVRTPATTGIFENRRPENKNTMKK